MGTLDGGIVAGTGAIPTPFRLGNRHTPDTAGIGAILTVIFFTGGGDIDDGIIRDLVGIADAG